MDLVDVFMRKYRVKFDVKECMEHYSRCRGQLAVECGHDPPGGLSTLSAHQIPARLISAKGYLAMMTKVISLHRLRLLFGAKIGKGRVRCFLMWLPHHSRLGKGVERGHMTCLPHLSWVLTVFSTRMSWGLALLGWTRKPWGRVRLSISRVLVGLSMMHAPTPVMRVKNKRASRTSPQVVINFFDFF